MNKQVSYAIHDVIPKKYHKYPSNTILKHVNVLAKVNKLPQGGLHNMTPHDAYIITTHIRTVTLVEISHTKRIKYRKLKKQESK